MGLKSYKIGEEDPAITHAPGMGGHNSMTDGAQLFEASAFEALIIKTTLPWARKKWPVAAANLQHYINNTGTLRTMDMKKMLSESLSAKQNYESELAQAIKFVESLDTGTYDITSSTYSLGGTHDNPNWYYAIGVYKGWGKGRASVFCVNKEKDKYWYSLNFTYKMSDYYNWHRLKSAVVLGFTIPDEKLGALHLAGLAKEYEIDGVVTQQYIWRKGEAPEKIGPSKQKTPSPNPPVKNNLLPLPTHLVPTEAPEMPDFPDLKDLQDRIPTLPTG